MEGAWGGQAGRGAWTSGGQRGREDQQRKSGLEGHWFWGDGGWVLTPGDIRAEGAPQPVHRLDTGLEISLGEERQERAGCHGGGAGPQQVEAPGQGSDGTPTVRGPGGAAVEPGVVERGPSLSGRWLVGSRRENPSAFHVGPTP